MADSSHEGADGTTEERRESDKMRNRWRCIIFVERKTTAFFLQELISRLETLNFLQCVQPYTQFVG